LRLAERAEMPTICSTRYRAVIDQPLGFIMGQNRRTADEPFDVLRTAGRIRRRRWDGSDQRNGSSL